jgi:glycosyltransferase involved in cell wall biosynthesis
MSHELANAFTAHGIATTLLAPRGSEAGIDSPKLYDLIIDEAADVTQKSGVAWTLRELPRLLSFLRGVYERLTFKRVILMHPHYYGPAFNILSKSLPFKVSQVYHGYEFNSLFVRGAAWADFRSRVRRRGPTHRELVLRTAQKADQIIVNSTFTEEVILKSNTKVPILVAGCGISESVLSAMKRGDYEISAKEKIELRRTLGVEDGQKLVGMLGRLSPSKNIEMLLRTLALQPQLTALIMGTGGEEDRLRAQAKALGVSERVIWAGNVSNADKWIYLSLLDVFCILSCTNKLGQVEGFGIVMLEASACGIPIVGTRSGGIGEFLQHGINGLCVDVDDDVSLGKAILDLTRKSTQSQSYVKASQALIETRYNWPSIAEHIVSTWPDFTSSS